MLKGEHGGDRLDGPGGAEEMAGHGLRRAHGQPVGVRTKHLLDGMCLVQVIVLGRRAMGVDVVDFVRGHPRIGQRQAHRPGVPVGRGRRGVIGVGGRPIASQLGVDMAAPAPCVLELLQDQDSGSFAQNETVSVLVEGPTGLGRSVVAYRQGSERAEARHHKRADQRIRAAGDHYIRVVPFDVAKRFPNGLCAGGARRGGARNGSARPGAHGDPAGRHVRQEAGHSVRVHASHLLLQQPVVGLEDQRQAAQRGPD